MERVGVEEAKIKIQKFWLCGYVLYQKPMGLMKLQIEELAQFHVEQHGHFRWILLQKSMEPMKQMEPFYYSNFSLLFKLEKLCNQRLRHNTADLSSYTAWKKEEEMNKASTMPPHTEEYEDIVAHQEEELEDLRQQIEELYFFEIFVNEKQYNRKRIS
ncbi:hypothetical protein CAEBREN_32184 [Caenorhabditis brenneri]|uniref:Uncharacterized protein n=1 Tax=Caenorhabditis brenneri TaxID=135651 RepID=G0PDP2_CAEBE|nr:hypothetical protein CAEBREN_32184 [Caenorhabditis brenneri]